jgi:ferredoxin-NADP reductase
VFIAGGIGITPLRSDPARAVARQTAPALCRADAPSAAFVDALQALRDEVKRSALQLRSRAGGQMLDIPASSQAPAQAHIYCGRCRCSMPSKAVAKSAARRGARGVFAARDSAHRGGFTVELARTGRSVERRHKRLEERRRIRPNS